ncbi:hypothetical protein EEL42_09095 [Muribaculaceae bacterium Isolate-100 (HZI)]|nr:hypothetical protein EEL42_09095 [Muribaculaceae bacterium Isolate-100 (HZI)]
MRDDRFEYFLNAVHYCIWRGDIRVRLFFDKIMGGFLLVFATIFLSKKYKARLYAHVANHEKETHDYFYNKKTGFHIRWASYRAISFYLCYVACIAFLLEGILYKTVGLISSSLFGMVLITPIWLCYMPANEAIFADDRYLKYFKEFEKMDKSWHRKWVMITWAFCVGGILAFFGGIIALFAIAIGWNNVHLPFSGY